MPVGFAGHFGRTPAARITAVAALVGALGASACSDDEDPTNPTDDVIGTWFAENSSGQYYAEITASTLTLFTRTAGGAPCFTFVEYEIQDVDGNEYVVREEGQAATCRLRRPSGRILAHRAPGRRRSPMEPGNRFSGRVYLNSDTERGSPGQVVEPQGLIEAAS